MQRGKSFGEKPYRKPLQRNTLLGKNTLFLGKW